MYVHPRSGCAWTIKAHSEEPLLTSCFGGDLLLAILQTNGPLAATFAVRFKVRLVSINTSLAQKQLLTQELCPFPSVLETLDTLSITASSTCTW